MSPSIQINPKPIMIPNAFNSIQITLSAVGIYKSWLFRKINAIQQPLSPTILPANIYASRGTKEQKVQTAPNQPSELQIRCCVVLTLPLHSPTPHRALRSFNNPPNIH
jgi:hypothetical protein